MLNISQLRKSDAWSFLTSTVLHSALIIVLAILTFAPRRQEEQISALTAVASDAPGLDEVDTFQLEQSPQSEAPQESVESSMSAAAEMPLVSTDAFQGTFSTDAVQGTGKSSGEKGEGVLKSTLFGAVEAPTKGKAGIQGLVGKFFDFKQDRFRKKLDYPGTFPDYIDKVNRIASANFSAASTKGYYQAPTQLVLSQLLIPASTSANDAPKAFSVEKEVEPRGWMVHYSGTVIPPKNGQWRFVGFFDDLLIVYVNGKPVLDAGWVPMCNVGRGEYDKTLRQDFGGPSVSGDRKAYSGKWFNANGPIKLDVLIGETPGGLVGGLLMCEKKGTDYKLRQDGTPILPLFATSMFGYDRIEKDAFAKKYQFMPEPPIWKPVKR